MIDVTVKAVSEPGLKAAIAEDVLLRLPDWFGLPDRTSAYIEESREMPFPAAYREGQAVGFITRKQTSPEAAEIHCMGVLPEMHRAGAGRKLVEAAETDCRREGLRLLQVKTVQEGRYAAYDKTNAFYRAMGFYRLEVFPAMWDKWNPCQVLVKPLDAAEGPPAAPEDPEIREGLQALTSLVSKSRKVLAGLKTGSAAHTTLTRRLRAFERAQKLLKERTGQGANDNPDNPPDHDNK